MGSAIVGIVALVITLSIIGCQDDARASQAPGEKILVDLAARHQAVTNWVEDVAYTFQLQDRLVSDRPVAFEGTVDDIFYQDGEVVVRFSFTSYGLPYYIVVDLVCPEHMKTILKPYRDGNKYPRLAQYVVVAKIVEANKAAITLVPYGYDIEEHSIVGIDVDTSDLIVAKGTCVDVAYID